MNTSGLDGSTASRECTRRVEKGQRLQTLLATSLQADTKTVSNSCTPKCASIIKVTTVQQQEHLHI
jgi:hypothetical protein